MTKLSKIPTLINLPEIVGGHFFKAEFPKYIVAKISLGSESKYVLYVNPGSEDDHLTLEEELKGLVANQVSGAVIECVGGGRIAYAPGASDSCIIGITGKSSLFGTENKDNTVAMLKAAFPHAEKIVAF
ncbi:hypothetical protein HY971_02875 [Candidatus Kaiserbacteria bacterium]|nr:hypothetical protein [Candidatus Kaiserbacteria bacterium]